MTSSTAWRTIVWRHRYNGQQVVTLTIQRQPGTNTVAVVDAIRNLLPTFRQQLPAAIKLDVLYDRSESIRESVNDVQFSLMLAIALVVLVIFLFLRNVRATSDSHPWLCRLRLSSRSR